MLKSKLDAGGHGRIDDIECLRAIAIVFTLIHHMGVLFSWGNNFMADGAHYFAFWSGVDLFLCISGFVISRELLKNLVSAGTKEQFWRKSLAFWVKRIFRIWPTSWLWMAFILLCSIIFRKIHTFSSPSDVLQQFTVVAMQVENFHAWSCFVYKGGSCEAASPWWSLSLEEQFYILLPIAIFVFKKRIVFVIGIVTAILIFTPRPALGLMWQLRTDAIGLGVILAAFQTSPLYRLSEPTFLTCRRYAIPFVWILLILLTSLAAMSQYPLNVIPFNTGMIAIVSFCLVFVASFDRNYICRNKLLKAALLWIGSRSFAIYLIHWPMIYVTRTIWRYIEPTGTVFGGTYTVRYFITWILLTGILSELNYRFVERPLRAKGRVVAARIEAGSPATN